MNLNPKWQWTRFWMRLAGPSRLGRMAGRMAVLFAPPYKGRRYLAGLNPQGFVAPSATVYGVDLRRGSHVLIGDRVVLYGRNGGPVTLGDRVYIQQETIIESGPGGSLTIGAGTQIQLRCYFACYESPIRIGKRVQIAPYCSFFPYNHGMEPGAPTSDQPLTTKGGIVVEDDVTFGVGVTVLDGVRIGAGAVIGANALVMHDVPANAIVVGVPARVVQTRDDLAFSEDAAEASAGSLTE
jgi:acetyltransferase-like isoleucine patch superfamily enzyme